MNLKIKLLTPNKRRLKFILLVTACLFGASSFAQSVVSAGGNQFTSTEYQLNFTLGETAITTLQVDDVVLTQGFHQSRLEVTAVNELPSSNVNIKVFPNPTSDNLHISVDNQNFDGCYYILYSVTGEVLAQKSINSTYTQIAFDAFSPAVYYIKVFINNCETNTFKIIKN